LLVRVLRSVHLHSNTDAGTHAGTAHAGAHPGTAHASTDTDARADANTGTDARADARPDTGIDSIR
jgi:hypothetical protein